MDSHFVELTVELSNSISDVKKMLLEVDWIEKKTGVAIEKQRIVFRGKRLNDDEVISAVGLEEGFVLHLIAKLEQNTPQAEPPRSELAIPRDGAQNSPSRGQASEAIEEEVLGEVAEQEILAGILRTLSKHK